MPYDYGRLENPPYYLTAYGIAVKHGYQGTEEEWIHMIQESAHDSSIAAAESAASALQSKGTAEAFGAGTRGGEPLDEDDPAYHNNAQYYSANADTRAAAAADSAEDSEAYAIGKRSGADVDSDDPAYHNNSKYYSDLAKDYAEDTGGLVTTTVTGWLADNVDPETGYVLDRSLASSEAAAPADLVGELKSAIGSLAQANMQYNGWSFVSGAINSTGGVNTTSTNRIRNTGPTSTAAIAGDVIYISPEYKAAVAAYNSASFSASNFYGWIVPFKSPTNGAIGIPESFAGKYVGVSIRKVGYEDSDISADLSVIANHVKYFRSWKQEIDGIEAVIDDEIMPSYKHDPYRPGDYVMFTDIASYPDGWWTSTGTHGSNTYVRTELIPIYPGQKYYFTNRPNNGITGAFFDKNGVFSGRLFKEDTSSEVLATDALAVKETYVKPNGYTQSTSNYLGDASDYLGIYSFTTPPGAYYVSININADNVPFIVLSTKPIWHLNSFYLNNKTLGDKVIARDQTITPEEWAARIKGTNVVIPANDTAFAEYNRRKLCVIGPSTVMIDRRNPNKNGLTEYIVGWQEYLRPYYGEVASYGYSGASWGDAYIYDGTYHSIHTMICGDNDLGITGVDVSGYDDFVLAGSTNGLTTTGAGSWDTDTPDTDTYLGALRATIDYIFASNSRARVWVYKIVRSGAGAANIPIIDTINTALEAMGDTLGINIIDFNRVGLNAWTRVWASGGEKGWTYDGTHYNHYGSYMIGQKMRHLLVGR